MGGKGRGLFLGGGVPKKWPKFAGRRPASYSIRGIFAERRIGERKERFVHPLAGRRGEGGVKSGFAERVVNFLEGMREGGLWVLSSEGSGCNGVRGEGRGRPMTKLSSLDQGI